MDILIQNVLKDLLEEFQWFENKRNFNPLDFKNV